MEKKIALYGFNNLTKTLSFNIYDVCYAKTEREQRDYIAYIDEQYNSERLTGILCKVTEIIRLKNKEGGQADNYLVIGEVVGVHLDPSFIKDGIVQISEMQPIARCGYLADYTVLDDLFQMTRPR